MIETNTIVGTGMKIVCQRDDLAQKLGVVARAVSTRASVQILSGVLLRAEAGQLHLAATDMELSLRASLDAQVEGDGAIVVPGRLLVDLIRLLPESEVTLEHRAEENVVHVASGSSTSTLHTYAADDFPRLPDLDAVGTFTVDREALLDTVSRVARSASRDESRPVLTGILVRFETGKLVMAATDSYRLSVKETELQGDAPELEAIIPARALGELGRVAQAGDTIDLCRGHPAQADLAVATCCDRRRRGRSDVPDHADPVAWLIVETVSLRNIRSYARLDVELEPGLILVVGPNGAGKTNLLESLHLGTQGFSPRTRADAQLIRFGERAGRVALHGERGGTEVQFEVSLELGGAKRAKLNGAPLRAAEQLRLEVATLVFTPDRLAVVKGGPAVRRAYFDRVLGRLAPARATLSAEYGAAVAQRNAALRRIAAGFSSRDALAPWPAQVGELGAALGGGVGGVAAG